MNEALKQAIAEHLSEGDTYLCGVLHADGQIHHTVIKAYAEDDLEHGDHIEAARSKGLHLMNRVEGAVFWDTQREKARELGPIWLEETADWDSAYAWFQLSGDGTQHFLHESAALRAVVVSRFTTQFFIHSEGAESSSTEVAA